MSLAGQTNPSVLDLDSETNEAIKIRVKYFHNLTYIQDFPQI